MDIYTPTVMDCIIHTRMLYALQKFTMERVNQGYYAMYYRGRVFKSGWRGSKGPDRSE